MPTSDITRLLAAITAVREAQEAFAQPMPIHERIYFERREALSTATNEFWKLATLDTIEALVKVAEAERDLYDAALTEACSWHSAGWLADRHLEAKRRKRSVEEVVRDWCIAAAREAVTR